MAKQKSAECVDRVGPADAGMLDAYIAACRQQAGAVAALEKLTPAVLKILQEMQVVTRDGAKLKLDMSYGYEYSHAVQIAGRALIEMKEYERNAGTATVSNVYRVEFQDAAAP